MKILHAPVNISGMPYVLAKAQRDKGCHAASYSISPSAFQYDIDIQCDVTRGGRERIKAVFNIFKFVTEFDVFHFYYGNSLTGSNLYDIRLLKRLGKKIFFYFCGCDIRDSKEIIAKYEFSACKHCWPMRCSSNRDRAYSTAMKFADAIFVSTPDLIEFVPGAFWLPPPVSLETLDNLASKVDHARGDDTIIVAHAPTSRMIKGSDYLIDAIDKLKEEGFPIELRLIENMPHAQALREYAKADIVVDQLLIGWYGLLSIEMMALGKPVICYIREDLRHFVADDLPLLSADIVNVKDVLKTLVLDRAAWEKYGARGREFVNKYHSAAVVAEKALEIYRQCGS